MSDIMFLFERPDGETERHACSSWDEAERIADDNGWTLLGEFISEDIVEGSA
jgi:hypothetical protein